MSALAREKKSPPRLQVLREVKGGEKARVTRIEAREGVENGIIKKN